MPGKSSSPEARRKSRLLRISSRTVRPRSGGSAQGLFFRSRKVRGSGISALYPTVEGGKCGRYKARGIMEFYGANPRLGLTKRFRALVSPAYPGGGDCDPKRTLLAHLFHSGATMKKTLLMAAALVVLAGCGE